MTHARYNVWRTSGHDSGDRSCVRGIFTNWCKSSYSDANGNCVEVAMADRTIAVRDSKLQDRGPVLEFTISEWDAFVRAAKYGEFDL